jgi:hypothetical protein
MSTLPPRAAPVLQIGFTGHRNLPNADAVQLQARMSEVLATIESAARAALASGWPGLSAAEATAQLQLRGISALAAGADRLMARAVLAAHWPLVAPLPFARETYRGDFAAGDETTEYDALLALAASVHELDGIAGRTDAYRAVGRVVLEQSDILIAVWDGDLERGPGGTAEVVREARATDIPVIVIAPAAPHALRVLATGSDSIAAIVTALLAPPKKSDVDAIGCYYQEANRNVPGLARLLSRLERPLLAFRPPQAAQAVPPPPVIGSDAADAPFALAQAALLPALEAADQLAVRYATLYRASISLKWLAVFPSAFAALVLLYVQAPWAAPLSLVAQVVSVITFLIGFNDRHNGWHRRFLDYRFMAEHLRYAPLMAMFGSTSTLPRLPPYQASANSDWVNWYLRFSLRKLGLVPARRDGAFIARMRQLVAAQITDQARFYAARSCDAQLLAKWLQTATMIAYFAAWGLGMLGSLLKFSSVHDIRTALNGAAGGQDRLLTTLSILFLLAASATIFGMLWPAISGFRAQREYFRLSQRYDAMVRQLSQLEARLARDGAIPGQVERVAREAVDAMLAEVSDWRVLIKARDFSAY